MASRRDIETLGSGPTGDGVTWSSLRREVERSGSRHPYVVPKREIDEEDSGYGFEVCRSLMGEGGISKVCFACKRSRKVSFTSAHNPVSIFAYPNTRASFLEFEILKQLYAVCILGVLLQASFPLPRQPFWEWSCG